MTREPFFTAADFDAARDEFARDVAARNLRAKERREYEDMAHRLRWIRMLCRGRSEPLAKDVLTLAGEDDAQ